MKRFDSVRGLVFCALGGLMAQGCGNADPERLPVHPVTGMVMVDGELAAGVFVALHPVEGSKAAQKHLTPCSTTDEDGQFVLSTYDQNDGAPAGDYRVTVQWMQEDAPNGKALPPGLGHMADKFKGQYSNAARSEWKIEVNEGENRLKPIEIPATTK